MDTSATPKISVILPIYNTEDFLEQAIESALIQTLANIQIILVNDGSTDSSLSIIKRYAEVDSRVFVIDKRNGGYSDAMNCGLDVATGEYIAILEPDDYIAPDMFERLAQMADEFDPRPDIVKSPYWRVVTGSKTKTYIYPSPHKETMAHLEGNLFTMKDDAEVLFYHPSIWSALYRRAFLEENDIRFISVAGAAWSDNPFFIETMILAQRITYVDECFYFYRENLPGSSSALKDYTIPFDRWNEMEDFLDAHDAHTPEIDEAMAFRAMCYIIGARKAENAAENALDVENRADAMYARLDQECVLASDRTTKTFKREYLDVIDPDYDGKIIGGYNKHLVGRFVESVREGGLGLAMYRSVSFLKNRF